MGSVARVGDSSADNCAICQDKLSNDVFVTHCAHKFDSTCINKWITSKSNGGANDVPCPLCRRVIIPKNSIDPDQSIIHSVARGALPQLRIAPLAEGSINSVFSSGPSPRLQRFAAQFARIASVVGQLPPLTPEAIARVRNVLQSRVEVQSQNARFVTSVREILRSFSETTNSISNLSTNLQPLNLGVLATHVAARGHYGPSRDRVPTSVFSLRLNQAGVVQEAVIVRSPNPLDVPEHNLYSADPELTGVSTRHEISHAWASSTISSFSYEAEASPELQEVTPPKTEDVD